MYDNEYRFHLRFYERRKHILTEIQIKNRIPGKVIKQVVLQYFINGLGMFIIFLSNLSCKSRSYLLNLTLRK